MAAFFGLSIAPQHSPVSGAKNDLHLDDTGNLAVVSGAEAVAQHARARVKFWRQEWFLNRDAGIDYTRYILGRQPGDLSIAEAVLKREILATPGVAEILDFDIRLDRASRGIYVERCTIRTADDLVIDLF